MQIAFLGLGQIGGSVARAAAASGFATAIRAWTPTGRGPAAGAAFGIVPCARPKDAIAGADLVVLAAPPLACLELVDVLGGQLRASLAADAVITDVASTKVLVVDRARAHGLRFVGGHPMAGRETAGFRTADPDLFRDRPWVVVPAEPADGAADARVESLAAACGARPVLLNAVEHDRAVAAISHAPLVLSAALVEAIAGAPGWAAARDLAAGGWASMTRLARGDPAMGAGILATNAAATADSLRAVRAVIDDWVALLEAGRADSELLEGRLAAAREQATSRDSDDEPSAMTDEDR